MSKNFTALFSNLLYVIDNKHYVVNGIFLALFT